MSRPNENIIEAQEEKEIEMPLQTKCVTSCRLRNHSRVRVGRKIKLIDTCYAPVIRAFNQRLGERTIACCCGHGRYHPTIFYRKNGKFFEYFSELEVHPIKRRWLCFYQRDAAGFYYNQKVEDLYRENSEREKRNKD